MQPVLALFNLADNPVFHRYRRSQLRRKLAIFWYLATLIVTTFVISIMYLSQTNFIGFSEQTSARQCWIALLVIQGLILLIKGTGRTSAGLIQDKIDQTLDYQRLTPVSPLRNVIGYLFGLPILEYVMFALTLPHLVFIVIMGNIPVLTVLAVYLAFFTCAIFYHMTAVAIGMVMKRWLWGYLLSIFSVAFLNLFLAPLGSQLGLKFMQFLSVFPVIGQKVVPLAAFDPEIDRISFPGAPQFPPGQAPPFGPPGPGGPFGPGAQQGPFGPGAQQGPFGPQSGFSPPDNDDPVFSFADPVPFFEWTLSPFVFTLLLQAGLIVTFATMAVRRWQKEDKHSLSKPYALGILAVFVVLVTGNLWPIITGQYLPFSILGNTSLDQLGDYITVALPIVYSVAVLMLCLFLFANTVPTHHAYVRGVRRAKKHGLKSARPWDDDAANIPFMCLFVLVVMIGYWVLVSRMGGAGYFDFLENSRYASWRLPLALGLFCFYTLLLLQVLENRGAMLSVLLLWLLPILVAVVAAAAMEDVSSLHTVVASASPIAMLLMNGALPIESLVPIGPNEDFDALITGASAGFVFIGIQIALLGWRWHQLRRTLS
jgi:hypothetical protein